jgi:heptosyltransferase-1
MPRILFVKTSSLGDVVHHCPAVSDLARSIPGAEIDWVVEAPFADVPAMHAAVRRVIPVAVRRWRASLWNPMVWAEMIAARGALRETRYDAVVDSQSLLKSALLASFARGPLHGMDRASARESFATRLYDVHHEVPKGLHAVERNRRLTGAALGYAPNGACIYGLKVEGAPPIETQGPYAVLLTMTSRADKLWPESRWVELGRALRARSVRALLPWGSAEERARCERLAAAIGEAQVPARMEIIELARLFRGARAVAGVDTGLVHLAAALGAPTVGIYGASDPGRTGLYGAARAVNVGADCAPPPAAEVLEALEALW